MNIFYCFYVIIKSICNMFTESEYEYTIDVDYAIDRLHQILEDFVSFNMSISLERKAILQDTLIEDVKNINNTIYTLTLEDYNISNEYDQDYIYRYVAKLVDMEDDHPLYDIAMGLLYILIDNNLITAEDVLRSTIAMNDPNRFDMLFHILSERYDNNYAPIIFLNMIIYYNKISNRLISTINGISELQDIGEALIIGVRTMSFNEYELHRIITIFKRRLIMEEPNNDITLRQVLSNALIEAIGNDDIKLAIVIAPYLPLMSREDIIDNFQVSSKFNRIKHIREIETDNFIVDDIRSVVGERIEYISKGSYGEVWLYRNANGKEYAVKYVKSIDDVFKEVAIQKYLNQPCPHPNIMYPVKMQISPPIMAMPRADASMRNVLLSTKTSRQWAFYQIFRALKYIHSRHVWHLDIKPANILICGLGKHTGSSGKEEYKIPIYKLADFGLSLVYAAPGMNSTNVITPFWRPPELFLKYPDYTETVDVWSVGVMMVQSIINTTNIFNIQDLDYDIEAVLVIMDVIGSPPDVEYKKQVYDDIKMEILSERLRRQYLQHMDQQTKTIERRIDSLGINDPDELEVIEACLRWPNQRMSASDILNLQYFKGLEDKINSFIPSCETSLYNSIDIMKMEQVRPSYRHISSASMKARESFLSKPDVSLNSFLSYRSLMYFYLLIDIYFTSPININNNFPHIYTACVIISTMLDTNSYSDIDWILEEMKMSDDYDIVMGIINDIVRYLDFDMIFPSYYDFIKEYTNTYKMVIYRAVITILKSYEYTIEKYTPEMISRVAIEYVYRKNNLEFNIPGEDKLLTPEIYNYINDNIEF